MESCLGRAECKQMHPGKEQAEKALDIDSDGVFGKSSCSVNLQDITFEMSVGINPSLERTNVGQSFKFF